MNRSGFSSNRRRLLFAFAMVPLTMLGARISAQRIRRGQSDVVPNGSDIGLSGQRYWVETPQHAHNLQIFDRGSEKSPVLRFELKPGEQRKGERGARERVELRSRIDAPLGATRWYSGAFRIADFVPDGDFNIIAQWISEVSARVSREGAGPWLRFELKRGQKGKLQISHRGSDKRGRMRPLRTTTIDVEPYRWYNFVVEARTGLTDGLVRVWIDGRKVVDWTGGPLGDFYTGSRIEPSMGVMKFGLYRWGIRTDKKPVTSTATVWFTNIEQGHDLSDRIDRPLPLPSANDFE